MNTHTPESRRLKAAGLLLAAATSIWIYLFAEKADAGWPLGIDALIGLLWNCLLAVNLIAGSLVLMARGCGMPELWNPPRRRRATLLWWLIVNLLALPLVAALLDTQDRLSQLLAEKGWDTGASFVGGLFGLVLWRLWRRSRRHLAPSADDAQRSDPRPPILYLRSFADDETSVVDDGGFRFWSASMSLIGVPNPEQEMAAILERAGPVVAIGRPGEELPQLGAARLYVSNDRWQAEVLALMTRAQLVVIRIGASPGVRWEIDQAFDRVPRDRIVLNLFGPSALKISPEIESRLAPLLGNQWASSLPEPPPSGLRAWGWRDPRRRVGSLVCFPTAHPPVVVPMANWPLWCRDAAYLFIMRTSALPLRRAWREVFRCLGVDSGTFVAPHSRTLAALLALFFGGFGVHWFYLGRRRRGWVYLLLFPFGSFLAGIWDAVRFIWMDREHFEALTRAAVPPRLVPPPLPVSDKGSKASGG
ncbi:MAG: TM2 domain-containing protein [Verrucomicrobiota bacterium]